MFCAVYGQLVAFLEMNKTVYKGLRNEHPCNYVTFSFDFILLVEYVAGAVDLYVTLLVFITFLQHYSQCSSFMMIKERKLLEVKVW